MTIKIYNRKTTEPTVYKGIKYFVEHGNRDLTLFNGNSGCYENDYFTLILNENILYFTVEEDK